MSPPTTRVTLNPVAYIGVSRPDTTNLVTAVANAFVHAAPMIAIGGSSPRVYLEMEAFQEIDQVAVMKPITKWATRVYDAKRIPEMVATAYRQAMTGKPGPVDRKSTRLNSSHRCISYAVFCLKKKKR